MVNTLAVQLATEYECSLVGEKLRVVTELGYDFDKAHSGIPGMNGNFVFTVEKDSGYNSDAKRSLTLTDERGHEFQTDARLYEVMLDT